MQVQDAIHGYIELNDLEEQVLDTPEMQRLRRVKQLGFSNLVYPSATHTRFEHSLGAMHIAAKFADSLDAGPGREQELRLAALLHDLGHGPFSHTTDFIFHDNGLSHEHFSKEKIQDSEIADLLREQGIHPGRVTDLIDGKGRLGSIIAGHIDVDRMDYLMRDAHYTGVGYGTIDADTIIRAADIHDQQLVFDKKYVNALESLLMARYLMIPTVYTHRVSRIASLMFRTAFERLCAEDAVAAEDLTYMDDPEITMKLRNCDASKDLMQRIETRNLYKTAASFEQTMLDSEHLRSMILDETGLDRERVLIDAAEQSGEKTYDVPVLDNGEVTMLDELSHLPSALKTALDQQRTTRIYTPEQHVSEVKEAAQQIVS